MLYYLLSSEICLFFGNFSMSSEFKISVPGRNHIFYGNHMYKLLSLKVGLSDMSPTFYLEPALQKYLDQFNRKNIIDNIVCTQALP